MMMFLRCLGEAVVARGLKGLIGLVPFGDQVYDVAANAVENYRRLKREARLSADLEEVVQADMAQVREEARQIAQEVAAGRPQEEINQVEAYLAQVPGVIRQSLRRPQDPGGKTVPATLDLRDPVQLASVLPRRAPRFRIGDPVPHSPQWKLVEMLGCGGFGEVWLARHTFLDQTCAVKFCLDSAARDRLLRHEGEIVKRVMAESRGVNATEHGIVPLVDAYLEGETPWLAYQYVDGGDLTGLARQMHQLPPPERGAQALNLLQALASVVGRFHRLPQPIIHRDLKPANILLARHGERWLLRVTDFGISHIAADQTVARATVSTPNVNLGETFRGAHTPLYASPQQKRGLKADVRDDVHALGVIGYQLLLGDLSAERPAGKWRKRVADCGLSEATLELLESCWDDDPEERPRDALALVEALRASPASATKTKAPSAQPVETDSWQDIDRDYESYLAHYCKGNGTRDWLQRQLDRIGRWEKGAECGNVKAMVLLGDCHDEGVGVPQDSSLAMTLYRKAAGDGLGMTNLGTMYAIGRGTSQDHAEAMRWFRKAADAGNAVSMNWIGWAIQTGAGVASDCAEAIKWYRKAAAGGYALGMRNVGELYFSGQGVSQDYAEALRWYRRAADAGNAQAMHDIGWLYHNGLGVRQDYYEAMKCYRQAADAGNIMAMGNLGWLIQNGWGARQDYGEAMHWYRQAADGGEATAMTNIGWLYHNGWGVRQDYGEAMRWYRQAADKGVAAAMTNLGSLYENGWGVRQDQVEAAKWYRQAADGGNDTGMTNLGWLYHNGWGVRQDYAEAIKWYRQAAAAGNAKAMCNLGWLIQNGWGAGQDYAEPMRWYRQAADKGSDVAMNNIGWLYYNGWGVSQDNVEAMRWYRQAADKGNAKAMVNLGWLYEQGWGTTRDIHTAREWYRRAVAAGNHEAQANLDRLAGK